MNIGIVGVSGKMGRELVRCASKNPALIIQTAIVSPTSSYLGQEVGTVSGIAPIGVYCQSNLAPLPSLDVLIDFSSPAGTKQALEWALMHHLPIVIGTTGLSEAVQNSLQQATKQIPVFYAANFSIGMTALSLLCRHASALLPSYTRTIEETHHTHKKDAPSGSALVLQKALGNPNAPITSKREGEVVGSHTVFFHGPWETLSLSHTAQARTTFAQGALEAAIFLKDKPPSLYTMEDLIQKDPILPSQ